MRPIRLLNLLNRNAKRGEFRAEGDTIFLYDVIVGSDDEAEWWGGVSPGAFARQLASMSGTVHLRINSPGGEVFAARAMAQAINEYDGEVIAHVDGLAASAATFVATAANKVVMAPGSMFMIHNAWTIALGNADELTQTAALLTKIDGTIAESYAAKAGRDPAEFADLMAAETWFSAQEAVDVGLADEVAGSGDSASNRAKWDLSAYEHAPAAENAGGLPLTLKIDASALTEALDGFRAEFKAALAEAAKPVRESERPDPAVLAGLNERFAREDAVGALTETA